MNWRLVKDPMVFIEYLRKNPLGLLLVILVLAAVGGFLEIASEIREKETDWLDEYILLSMRIPGDTSDPVGSPKVEEMARDLTAMGGVTILSIVTLTAFGLALFSGKKKLAWFGLASVLVGSLITAFLKHGYNRPRPSLVEHGAWVSNPSFPSGHSMMSAVVYLTLGILIARTQPKKRVRIFIVFITILLTFLVGMSRVYLGVHWPTDVVGGWMLGATWALLFWILARKIGDE